MPILRFGIDSLVRLESAAGATCDQLNTPSGEPLCEVAEAVRAALASPLEYPSFHQSTTPGDQVVVAVGPEVPQAALIIATVIQALIEAGVHADGIHVLRTGGDLEPEDFRALLHGKEGERIQLHTHDPKDRDRMAYLAANADGEPILLNRLMTDADLVVPIGCLRAEKSRGYFGIHTPIFPAFSDAKTQIRFRRNDLQRGHGHPHRDLVREAADVAWQLGINFTIQVVPGGKEDILHVVAGQSDAVRRRGRELYREAWHCLAPRRAGLVVAGIEGTARHQTWENLGRALTAAEHLVEEGGVVAVCCDLATEPGPAVQRLVGAAARDVVLREIRRDGPTDALPAAQLAHALDRCHVYLLSRLDPALVEELEVTPIGGPDELARLARQHRSVILLPNSPYAVVSVADEEGEG